MRHAGVFAYNTVLFLCESEGERFSRLFGHYDSGVNRVLSGGKKMRFSYIRVTLVLPIFYYCQVKHGGEKHGIKY